MEFAQNSNMGRKCAPRRESAAEAWFLAAGMEKRIFWFGFWVTRWFGALKLTFGKHKHFESKTNYLKYVAQNRTHNE